MLNFLLLMLIPVAIATFCVFYFRGRVTVGEFVLQLIAPAVCLALGLGIAYYQSTTDYEVWNGRVAAKQRLRVNCRHSYSCNCYTSCSGAGKSRSCSTICQTCYEHSYDIDWNILSTTNEGLSIDTIDRQGLKMPPRWGAAFIGEPFSSKHEYTNYILANPDSVLLGGKGDVKRFAALLPAYPSDIYDYYRANHVLNLGAVPIADMPHWKWLINEVNGDLGVQKQVNVTLLFVKTDDPTYVLALKDHWIGGKKNDAVIIIGSLDGRRIAFADVISWSPAALFKIAIKDDITRIGTLDQRDAIVNAIKVEIGGKYQRMHMKDYEYLVRSYQPSSGAMLFLLIFGTAISVGVGAWTVNNDIEDRYEWSN